MHNLDRVVLGAALLASASPAFASVDVPAPIAGVGIGAVMLIGAGYRAVKSRIK